MVDIGVTVKTFEETSYLKTYQVWFCLLKKIFMMQPKTPVLLSPCTVPVAYDKVEISLLIIT